MIVTADFLRRLAAAAAAETLPRFRQQGAVANKLAAGFDPVTEADREAELAIRRLIEEAFPGHGILGEEHGLLEAGTDYVWIIDPIDGTRSFISGVPLWGTLVGLTIAGDAVAGMMSQPFTGEIFLALNGRSHYEGPRGASVLAARRTVQLADATLCTTSPALFAAGKEQRYRELEGSVRMARYGTDCYGYAMIAAGQVDLVVESSLQPYDIVALIPIIEMAGGVVTTWEGGPAELGGDIVAAATPELHEKALRILAG